MYESFFGLRESAFALTPDPRFLWLSPTHEEGLAALFYGITRRKGFILLTGEVGAGKTTPLRASLDRIPAETESALVMNTADLRPLVRAAARGVLEKEGSESPANPRRLN